MSNSSKEFEKESIYLEYGSHRIHINDLAPSDQKLLRESVLNSLGIDPWGKPPAEREFEEVLKTELGDLFGDAEYWNILQAHHKASQQLVRVQAEESWISALRDVEWYIGQFHLGKGFDGDDRWEHCAAEILGWLKSQHEAKLKLEGGE